MYQVDFTKGGSPQIITKSRLRKRRRRKREDDGGVDLSDSFFDDIDEEIKVLDPSVEYYPQPYCDILDSESESLAFFPFPN